MEYRIDLFNKTPDVKIGLFSFTQYMPYIMDLTFYRYEFDKLNRLLKDIQFLNLLKLLHIYKYTVGLSGST